ncbi:uncharacterized protein Triagg1_9101 [Trichoderma aggressivum f. europaeum]|uniref:Uncharacterized protein n=1 Tax=Trichoderma aggressivum f. europaeum TaxID=173218 RepID=A0AAE1I7B7_9HYPO|nr:hypothetical protein Triagg1_9101 [Trichoderma aggressivum f. europaeum]
MVPCSEPYMESPAACKIEPKQPRKGCTWFSSVYGDRMEGDIIESLAGKYCKDNMANPVLVSTGVELAANGELPFDVAPKSDRIQCSRRCSRRLTSKRELQYRRISKFLACGKHDVECISETLGFLWMYLGSSGIKSSGINFRNLTSPKPLTATLHLSLHQILHQILPHISGISRNPSGKSHASHPTSAA